MLFSKPDTQANTSLRFTIKQFNIIISLNILFHLGIYMSCV